MMRQNDTMPEGSAVSGPTSTLQQHMFMDGHIVQQGQFQRPSAESQQRAFRAVAIVREQLKNYNWQDRLVPGNERQQFVNEFEKLHQVAEAIDQKMNFYACFLTTDGIRKVLLVITTAKVQRHLLLVSDRFIMDLKQLRGCYSVLQAVTHHVTLRLEQLRQAQRQQQQQAQGAQAQGSEAEIGHHTNMPDTAKIADAKSEELLDGLVDGLDGLQLGAWKEIDGGESSYYQAV
ncbi:hypothetical protein NM688_g1827 [Phlebia brevispora]|uniref:Uncharacterized protein n=1 Tax=Phlebia brevispora TaxID=194682 RepID=A0ACC1TA77_9APHY|nr:hypothetical protein NM688_g1827 [Phlebia brevispora]